MYDTVLIATARSCGNAIQIPHIVLVVQIPAVPLSREELEREHTAASNLIGKVVTSAIGFLKTQVQVANRVTNGKLSRPIYTCREMSGETEIHTAPFAL